MGKTLKHSVIAEGVETREQYAFLRDQQCDEGQGHYFGHPMRPELLVPLLQAGMAAKPDSTDTDT
ncbi:MAG TPA: EAL domain-containing protein, partial [Burkholderiales bacterium]|nr:EAL domain-containing protein [Burkholderiales bacterium]